MDQSKVKLIEWADKLGESLERHESKDRNFVVLHADECRELIAVMLSAASALYGWANGT